MRAVKRTAPDRTRASRPGRAQRSVNAIDLEPRPDRRRSSSSPSGQPIASAAGHLSPSRQHPFAVRLGTLAHSSTERSIFDHPQHTEGGRGDRGPPLVDQRRLELGLPNTNDLPRSRTVSVVEDAGRNLVEDTRKADKRDDGKDADPVREAHGSALIIAANIRRRAVARVSAACFPTN
jgi:hypothetical protein